MINLQLQIEFASELNNDNRSLKTTATTLQSGTYFLRDDDIAAICFDKVEDLRIVSGNILYKKRRKLK